MNSSVPPSAPIYRVSSTHMETLPASICDTRATGTPSLDARLAESVPGRRGDVRKCHPPGDYFRFFGYRPRETGDMAGERTRALASPRRPGSA